jgi:hypothetical protein
MFKSLFRLMMLALMLSGWGLAALSLHVVRTPDKIGLIPKERLGFTDTYVDARKWTLDDLQAHPDLVRRVLEAGKANLFQYLANPSGGDIASQLSSSAAEPAAQQNNSLFGRMKGLFSPAGRGTAAGTQSSAGFDTLSFPLEF